MRIPRKVQIGSVLWKIRITKQLPDGSEDWGMCDPDTSTIWIARGPEDVMRDTAMHEVLHAIVFTFGLMNDMKNEENIVKVFAPVLCSILKWGFK